MGVYIKGMEMPFTCLSCDFHKCAGGVGDYCTLTKKKQFRFKNRPSWCPLVPVPPHGRLIDADEAKNKIRPWSPEDETNGCTFDTVKKLMHKLLNDTPTVIEAEEGE